MYRLGVLGNDARMEHLYRALLCDGHSVIFQKEHGEAEVIEQSEVLILSLGMPIDKRMEGKTVLCGGVQKGGFSNVISYTDSDYFKIRNALPTAEGAIAIAMQNTDFTIAGSKCAVVGYGNIGKCLTDRLIALGANVSVYARREQSRAESENRGASAHETGELYGLDADIVFNTVPAPVLSAFELASFKTHPLIIDLASKPGGTDFEAAKSLGLDCIHALSLPGKFAPKTAGEILKDTVIYLLRGVK